MDLQHSTRMRRLTSIRYYLCFIATVTLFSCSAAEPLEILGNPTDRRTLSEFKSKLDDPLGSLSSWNSTTHFCRWAGVTCGKKHRRAAALRLKSTELAGSISPSIGNLSFLRILDLRNNSFHSGIPPEFGRLFRLRKLLLGNNSLGGRVPPSLSRCTNLVVVDLGYNMLEGNLPSNLTSLSKLRRFYLQYNNLVGEIPDSFVNLSSIEFFLATENNLGGVIPESLGGLRNIVNLALGGNNFIGNVPSSIFNISSIKKLDLAQNHLVGILPKDLGYTLPNLEFLGVRGNRFSGPIPTSISNASNLFYLGLNNNSFTGRIPSLENLPELWIFVIGYNGLGSGEPDDLSFLCSLTNSSALERVALDGNGFGGTIPACIGNLSTTMRKISFSNNSISGVLPSSIGNLVNLDLLQAWGNFISGSIPPEIGNLESLIELDLSENEFSGQIPESIGNLTTLTLLYLYSNRLGGTIPSSLSYCPKLLTLDLGDNELHGTIPREVIGLSSLSIYVDISQNHLTGEVPVEVGRLQNLGALDVSGNRLSGEIPSSLGSCTALEVLNMQYNLLEGPLPSTLRSLKGIAELNLSNNRLSGRIPEFLGDLPLTSLDLSSNEFDGALPTRGVFRNSSAFSVQGNEKLCGGLPEFRLPHCNNINSRKRRRRKFVRNVVIFSISGFLGFAILIASAFVYRSKRQRKEHVPSETTYGLLQVSYQSLLKATDGFSSDNLIGAGSFGSVFRGILDVDEQRVAIKVLNLGSSRASKSFVAECEALRSIRHRNLVKVLTACSGTDYQGNDFKALVYEFMAKGNLDEWLHPVIMNNDEALEEDEMPNPRRLGLVRRLDIAIDVACALEYLHHQCEIPMVHCDLKPSNVLLDDDMTGHVGDFGLVRFVRQANPELITDTTSSIGVKGSLGYIAPDYGAGGEVTNYGDVYSFGILVLEIFTGKRPTDEMFTDGLSLRSFSESALPQNADRVVDPFLLEDCLGSESNAAAVRRSSRFYKILESLATILEVGIVCSSELPQDRISMSAVVSKLLAVKRKIIAR